MKGNLWHGNVERALERIAEVQWDLELRMGRSENQSKLLKQLREFDVYIRNNQDYIPNYGERYRNKERIATSFVEATLALSPSLIRRIQRCLQIHLQTLHLIQRLKRIGEH